MPSTLKDICINIDWKIYNKKNNDKFSALIYYLFKQINEKQEKNKNKWYVLIYGSRDQYLSIYLNKMLSQVFSLILLSCIWDYVILLKKYINQ